MHTPADNRMTSGGASGEPRIAWRRRYVRRGQDLALHDLQCFHLCLNMTGFSNMALLLTDFWVYMGASARPVSTNIIQTRKENISLDQLIESNGLVKSEKSCKNSSGDTNRTASEHICGTVLGRRSSSSTRARGGPISTGRAGARAVRGRSFRRGGMGVECDQVGREETEGSHLDFENVDTSKVLLVPASAATTLRRASSAGHRSSGGGTLQQWQNLR